MNRDFAESIKDCILKTIENYNMRKERDNYTREGRIMAVLGNNKYTVNISNKNYDIFAPAKPSATYVVGDLVLIEVVYNNFSFKYIKCLKPWTW